MTCDDTTFTNCATKQGGGGAIYIENNLRLKNNITLIGLSFTDCKAKYGGAVYIYCGTPKAPAKVSSCEFSGNQLLPNSETDHLHIGGKAIFVVAKRGKISECKFHENPGEGEDMKIITTFDEDDYLLKDNHRKISIKEVEEEEYQYDESFMISNCHFDTDKQSRNSIYSFAGKHGTKVEVQNCIFTGDLSEGSHYISEKVMPDASSRMIVKSCKFASDSENSMNLNPINAQTSGNVFNYQYSKEVKETKEVKVSRKIVTTIAFTTLAVNVIVVIVAIIYKKRLVEDDSQSNISSIEEPEN